MTDLNEILKGTVEKVSDALPALSREQLLTLKALEEADKSRKGVFDAIEDALAAVTSEETSTAIPPATQIDPAGAPVQIVPDVDMTHPAVDNDPRAGTTDEMNRIDFNDPRRDGRSVVEAALAQNDEG